MASWYATRAVQSGMPGCHPGILRILGRAARPDDILVSSCAEQSSMPKWLVTRAVHGGMPGWHPGILRVLCRAALDIGMLRVQCKAACPNAACIPPCVSSTNFGLEMTSAQNS